MGLLVGINVAFTVAGIGAVMWALNRYLRLWL